MTSLDLERSRSRPQFAWGPLSRKRLEMQTQFKWSIIGNGSRSLRWSCPMTSRDPERSSSSSGIRLDLNILKTVRDRFQWTTNRKWHMRNRMVSDHMKKCKFTPRYLEILILTRSSAIANINIRPKNCSLTQKFTVTQSAKIVLRYNYVAAVISSKMQTIVSCVC